MLPYTHKEHYIAHILLTKFTKNMDKAKMTFAIHTFFHFDRNRRLGLQQSSVFYRKYKNEFIELCKTKSSGLNNGRSDKNTYKFKSPDNEIFDLTRIELNNLNTELTSYDINGLIRAFKNKTHWVSKGWSIFIPDLNLYTDEIKRTPRDYKRIECKYCLKIVSPGNYKRWHGENCKLFNIS
jgi:hypothetical protein